MDPPRCMRVSETSAGLWKALPWSCTGEHSPTPVKYSATHLQAPHLLPSRTSTPEAGRKKKKKRGGWCRGMEKDKGKQLAVVAWSREDWGGCGCATVSWPRREWRERECEGGGGWERGRENITYSGALTNQPHIPVAWSQSDKCSHSLSDSASCSSTPGKANVMAAHKLKSSPQAIFIHKDTHRHTNAQDFICLPPKTFSFHYFKVKVSSSIMQRSNKQTGRISFVTRLLSSICLKA